MRLNLLFIAGVDISGATRLLNILNSDRETINIIEFLYLIFDKEGSNRPSPCGCGAIAEYHSIWSKFFQNIDLDVTTLIGKKLKIRRYLLSESRLNSLELVEIHKIKNILCEIMHVQNAAKYIGSSKSLSLVYAMTVFTHMKVGLVGVLRSLSKVVHNWSRARHYLRKKKQSRATLGRHFISKLIEERSTHYKMNKINLYYELLINDGFRLLDSNVAVSNSHLLAKSPDKKVFKKSIVITKYLAERDFLSAWLYQLIYKSYHAHNLKN